MAFLARNTHRTFSAIFTNIITKPSTPFSQCNSLNLAKRTLYKFTLPGGPEFSPKLVAADEIDLSKQPNVEVLKNPPEWKYVERILPKATVPVPTPKAAYSSGWTPQDAKAQTYPYFIRRTRNHMVPIYLKNSFRGLRKQTIIKNISGDIWKLNHELMDYIEYYMAKKERSRVNEFTQTIKINGDYVNLIKDYLINKGI